MRKTTRVNRDELKTHLDHNHVEGLTFGSWSERYSLYQGLSTMLSTGVPFHLALENLAEAARNSGQSKYADICDSLLIRTSSGQRLPAAVRCLPKAFGVHAHRFLSIGESTGRYGRAFEELAKLEERLSGTQREMRRLLTYPAGILSLAIVVGSFTLFSLQSLLPFYEDLNSRLADFFRLLHAAWIAILSPYFWLPALLGISFLLSGLREDNAKRGLRLAWHRAWRHLPGFGQLINLSSNIQFCRTLSRLIDCGVPLTRGVEAAMMVANDPIFERKVSYFLENEQSILFHYPIFRLFGLNPRGKKKVRRPDSIQAYITDGHELHEIMAMHPEIFLPQVRALAASGEETGTLAKTLAAAADILEIELESKVATFKAVIGPSLLLVTGLFVGLVGMLSLYPVLQATKL